jgi:hypothetical protein
MTGGPEMGFERSGRSTTTSNRTAETADRTMVDLEAATDWRIASLNGRARFLG